MNKWIEKIIQWRLKKLESLYELCKDDNDLWHYFKVFKEPTVIRLQRKLGLPDEGITHKG